MCNTSKLVIKELQKFQKEDKKISASQYIKVAKILNEAILITERQRILYEEAKRMLYKRVWTGSVPEKYRPVVI